MYSVKCFVTTTLSLEQKAALIRNGFSSLDTKKGFELIVVHPKLTSDAHQELFDQNWWNVWNADSEPYNFYDEDHEEDTRELKYKEKVFKTLTDALNGGETKIDTIVEVYEDSDNFCNENYSVIFKRQSDDSWEVIRNPKQSLRQTLNSGFNIGTVSEEDEDEFYLVGLGKVRSNYDVMEHEHEALCLKMKQDAEEKAYNEFKQRFDEMDEQGRVEILFKVLKTHNAFGTRLPDQAPDWVNEGFVRRYYNQ